MREGTLPAATQADLLEHPLRRHVAEAGDAGNARKRQLDESIAQQRQRHFSGKPAAPRRPRQCEADLDDRLALDVIQIVAADGQWAALRQSRTCEAVSRSLGVVHKGRPPARASISFDAGGPRHGQLAVRLSRVPRPGATVMLYVGDQPFLLMNRDDMGWSRGPKQEQAIIAAMRSSGTDSACSTRSR